MLVPPIEYIISFLENILFIGALFKLKQKKLYEQEIDKIQNIKMTLETQVMNVSVFWGIYI